MITLAPVERIGQRRDDDLETAHLIEIIGKKYQRKSAYTYGWPIAFGTLIEGFFVGSGQLRWDPSIL